MPDWVKKTSRRLKGDLHADEELLAAMFVRPQHGDGVKRLGTPGGRLSNIERLADAETGASEGVAGTFPATNCVVGLTSERLLAFGHGALTGRVGRLEADFALNDVADVYLDGELGSADSSLVIAWNDGTEVRLVPGSRVRRFVRAFAETRGR